MGTLNKLQSSDGLAKAEDIHTRLAKVAEAGRRLPHHIAGRVLEACAKAEKALERGDLPAMRAAIADAQAVADGVTDAELQRYLVLAARSNPRPIGGRRGGGFGGAGAAP